VPWVCETSLLPPPQAAAVTITAAASSDRAPVLDKDFMDVSCGQDKEIQTLPTLARVAKRFNRGGRLARSVESTCSRRTHRRG
jgi:hypothetical protein